MFLTLVENYSYGKIETSARDRKETASAKVRSPFQFTRITSGLHDTPIIF